MYSSITIRRLKDGLEAIKLDIPNKGDIQQLIDYRHQIYSGIAALQSLDDLGEENNRKINSDILILQERFSNVSDQITELLTNHVNSYA
jgi:hypothetical protein